MSCKHGRISVTTGFGNITTGICDECDNTVQMEVIIRPNGKCLWWSRGAPEDRTEAHPANQHYVEIAPGVWSKVAGAVVPTDRDAEVQA